MHFLIAGAFFSYFISLYWLKTQLGREVHFKKDKTKLTAEADILASILCPPLKWWRKVDNSVLKERFAKMAIMILIDLLGKTSKKSGIMGLL